MIELNSITAVLMVEALVVLILLGLIFMVVFGQKSSGDQAAVHKLINKLKGSEKNKAEKRSEIIAEYCDVDPSALNEVLNEISSKERDLYKKIIQMFLSRDRKLLMQIDQHIDNLAKPYLSIAGISASNNEEEAEALETAKNEINRLKEESDVLRNELMITTDSMEEITAEYTRVFSGSQTELALENSSKKMFGIFRDTENRLKQSAKNIEIEDL